MVVSLSEEFIALSILRLVEMEKAVVEGAGAIGLAAVLGGYVPELTGKKYDQPASHSLRLVKAKFHYASWFGAGSELALSWFELKFDLSSSLLAAN